MGDRFTLQEHFLNRLNQCALEIEQLQQLAEITDGFFKERHARHQETCQIVDRSEPFQIYQTQRQISDTLQEIKEHRKTSEESWEKLIIILGQYLPNQNLINITLKKFSENLLETSSISKILPDIPFRRSRLWKDYNKKYGIFFPVVFLCKTISTLITANSLSSFEPIRLLCLYAKHRDLYQETKEACRHLIKTQKDFQKYMSCTLQKQDFPPDLKKKYDENPALFLDVFSENQAFDSYYNYHSNQTEKLQKKYQEKRQDAIRCAEDKAYTNLLSQITPERQSALVLLLEKWSACDIFPGHLKFFIQNAVLSAQSEEKQIGLVIDDPNLLPELTKAFEKIKKIQNDLKQHIQFLQTQDGLSMDSWKEIKNWFDKNPLDYRRPQNETKIPLSFLMKTDHLQLH